MFEYPSPDHQWNLPFMITYRGQKFPGVSAKVVSPMVVPGGWATYTPQFGAGHWSMNFPAPVDEVKKILSAIAKELFKGK